MKANTQYDDLLGTSAADISYGFKEQSLSEIADSFGINRQRFELIGLSLYGPGDFSLSFLCLDLEKSTDEKEHIVSMMFDVEKEDILNLLFERLSIVLHAKYDEKYPILEYNEEIRYTDFHEVDE